MAITACCFRLGPQAPWWVDNANLFLTPFMTRQAEIGAKYEPAAILLTAALFRMRAPFFYPKVIDGADSFCRDESSPAISALNPRATKPTTASN